MKAIKTKLMLLVVGIIAISCNHQSSRFNSDGIPKEVWTEYQSKDSIPLFLLRELKSHISDSSLFANPNEQFRAGDVILIGLNDKLPSRQLRYLGRSNNIWQLTYKHGGIGLHYHFIQSHFSNHDSTYDFITGVSLVDLDTRTQIDSAQIHDKIDYKQIEW